MDLEIIPLLRPDGRNDGQDSELGEGQGCTAGEERHCWGTDKGTRPDAPNPDGAKQMGKDKEGRTRSRLSKKKNGGSKMSDLCVFQNKTRYKRTSTSYISTELNKY